MTIGGYNEFDGIVDLLDDVEITSLHPELFPVPECLENLNAFPIEIHLHAGALDYSREFSKVCHILLIDLMMLVL